MQLPKVVTYKEVMIVYGFEKGRAEKKIWHIRGILGKKQSQSILIDEFCEAENVKKDFFISGLQEFYSKMLRPSGK